MQGSVGLGWPWEGWVSVCEGEEGLGVSCPALGRWPHSARPFQWVLAFEIFIPLVLFFILLGLRQKKPTISVKEGEGLLGPLKRSPALVLETDRLEVEAVMG